jgi:copper chaperone CopZ
MMALMPLTALPALAADKPSGSKPTNKQTVVLACDLHCQGCCDKIMKNIAWEKGVKDIVCDLPSKTVTVTFDTRKTDTDKLLQAFERIGKPAQEVKKDPQ